MATTGRDAYRYPSVTGLIPRDSRGSQVVPFSVIVGWFRVKRENPAGPEMAMTRIGSNRSFSGEIFGTGK